MENLIKILKQDDMKILSGYTENFKLKNGDFSAHQLKIATNKSYVKYVTEKHFSFSGLQNFCRNVNEKEFNQLTNEHGKTFAEFSDNKSFETVLAETDSHPENLIYFSKVNTWLKLRSLNIATNDIEYKHINTYGKEKELKNKSGEKKHVSLNLFLSCLERFIIQNGLTSKDEKQANETNSPETIETVIISEQPETIETVLTSVQKGMITKLTNKLKSGKIDQLTYNSKVEEIKRAA